jgi:pyroglutamyl-peptidase
MKILLTGFEPFGGEVVNSSQETIKVMACEEFDDVEVVTRILPVSFKRSGNAICEFIDDVEPDVVIMLGQSGKSDYVKIERVALNLMDSVNGDNDGYTPDEETICPDAPPAYFAQLPVKNLRDCLIQTGIPAKTSSSAGLYVCNRTYFAALHHIASTGKNTKAVFIHLPKISDEWPHEKIKTAVEKVITMLKP